MHTNKSSAEQNQHVGGVGALTVTHPHSATVPLRKCTCSHFLLFVWGGGLALGRYWAKLEHQSAQKTREIKDQQTLDQRRTPRHRPPAFGYRRTDMQFTGMWQMWRWMEPQR